MLEDSCDTEDVFLAEFELGLVSLYILDHLKISAFLEVLGRIPRTCWTPVFLPLTR